MMTERVARGLFFSLFFGSWAASSLSDLMHLSITFDPVGYCVC